MSLDTQMISKDNYTLELAAVPTESTQSNRVRAIAQNATTHLTVEVELSVDQARSLLARVYEEALLNSAIEQLQSGYPTVLLSAANARCIFTEQDLVEFGFDPLELP